MIAEDDDEVRALAREVLEGYGYTILEAARPADSLQIAERYAGAINLLLTDVVMPQMSGQQLADRLASLRPEMRVLYVSGYPGEAILQQGRLEAGTQYLPKPIMPAAWATKVREVLDAPGIGHSQAVESQRAAHPIRPRTALAASSSRPPPWSCAYSTGGSTPGPASAWSSPASSGRGSGSRSATLAKASGGRTS